MAFDLLYFDGHDLRNSELDVRRHLLEDLVPACEQGNIRLSEEIVADGDQLLATLANTGWKGSSPSGGTHPIAPAGSVTG